ncbi:MAG: aminotransferase class IV [Bythopirellula sp.]|nr:aminotransferase class IV [Bythopirellula sp.]
MSDSVAYFNGEWIRSTDLAVPVSDLGFLLGTTLTEKLRTFGGRPYRAEAHLARMRNSIEIMGWNADAIIHEAATAVDEFMTRNSASMVEGDDWNITLFVTPGKSADAMSPTVCVHGYPIPFHQWAHQFLQGVEAVIVGTRQVPTNCWPAELKCRSRMHYYLADRQAAKHSRQARAILLDQDGYVGEGSTANLIAYYADRGLVTPKIAKVLPGVSQHVIFDLAESLGIRHQEQDLLPADLSQADELYLSSTSICLLPVVNLDGLPIGTGQPGPVFQKLLTAWSEQVGVDIAAQAQKFAIR